MCLSAMKLNNELKIAFSLLILNIIQLTNELPEDLLNKSNIYKYQVINGDPTIIKPSMFQPKSMEVMEIDRVSVKPEEEYDFYFLNSKLDHYPKHHKHRHKEYDKVKRNNLKKYSSEYQTILINSSTVKTFYHLKNHVRQLLRPPGELKHTLISIDDAKIVNAGSFYVGDVAKSILNLERENDFNSSELYEVPIVQLVRHDTSRQSKIVWPVKHEAVVAGDIILGGLMMVHSREDSVTCGPIMPQGGVQALEAMLYTLDEINHKVKIVPNITFGAHILDDCDKDTYGLEMAVDFIKGSISNIDGAEYSCNRTAVRKVISGVIGAASSVTSVQVANLLRLFKIPQVSFFSTSPELSNKQRFEYFTRTIPSDLYQVKAMVDIVNALGWSYVSIIYEESNYGIKAFEELEALLTKHNICIAVKEKLVKDSGVADEGAYDEIVIRLLTKPRARGAIVFGSDQEVAGVMRAVERNNATGVFSWIGSDGWSARGLVSDGNERAVEGTLSVQPQANPVRGFKEYFLGLTVENNKRNPWFIEFWEDHFRCRYPGSAATPYNADYGRACTGLETLTQANTEFEGQLQFVSDAVMAFAYAIRDMHLDLCGGTPGLCDAMRPTQGPDLLRYLRTVNFEGLSGDHFHFDSNGDGPARYNILHFKQIAPGKYRWLKVGEYMEGELKLNLSEIQFKWLHRRPPESVCSAECELGQAKQYVEGESCCWHCFNCTQYEIRDPLTETACAPCPRGTLPNVARTVCEGIPEVFLRPESGWAIGAMSFSSAGVICTVFVGGVLLRHRETPVVRAAGRELSLVLLAGILMCYLVTFALVLRPSHIVCGLQRFFAGFCFTVVYAALLTKTNRIARIFRAGRRSAKRPLLISPRSQLAVCAGLISVQVFINAAWMVVSPARATHRHPTREDNLLVCDSYVDASYMIAFFYPIVLIVVCTVYAVLTRKIPEAFNESKHIGFTMYTTCVIWLAFVPLYFGTSSHVPLRVTSMAVTISLSASVTVACLFAPKLYIILVHPERNVRQSMMPVRYSSGGAGVVVARITTATCHPSPIRNEENGKPNVVQVSQSIQTDLSFSNPIESQQKATMAIIRVAEQQDSLKKFNNNLKGQATHNDCANCEVELVVAKEDDNATTEARDANAKQDYIPNTEAYINSRERKYNEYLKYHNNKKAESDVINSLEKGRKKTL